MKRKLKLFRVIFAVLLISLMMLSVIPVNASSVNSQKVNVLIGFTDMPGVAEEALVRAFGGTVKHTYSLINSIAARLPETALEALRKNPKIRIIEPDLQVYAIGTFEEELNKTWGMLRIGETSAHGGGYFGSGIKVAIIDSGIDKDHPELAAVYKGGWDFVNNDNDPSDVDGHGTHVTGTIAAQRNGEGVVGAAPEVEIYSLKALEGGSGYFSDIIAALEWCVVNDIQITNNSYGSSGDPGTLVKEAFDNSYNSGILHIAAAGNSGNRPGKGDNVEYPAKYSSVVAIAASDNRDSRASFSSTGIDVELIAPGVSIYSTWVNGYAYSSGTSMASPHVVGVAAQVWSVNKDLSNFEIRDIIKSTAEDLGKSALHQGFGLVRADLAIEAVLNMIPVTKGSVSGTVLSGSGEPLEGVNLEVSNTSFSAITDASGNYEIINIPTGIYTVTASVEGYYDASNDVTIEENITTVNNYTLYAKTMYSLEISSVGLGNTEPSEGLTYYEDGSVVELNAIPELGYMFEKWIINDIEVTNAQTSITMDSDIIATAYFVEADVPDIVIDIFTDKLEYSGNTWVYITVTLNDGINPISGTNVDLVISDPLLNEKYLAGITNGDGSIIFTYRVLKKSTKGTYKATASTNLYGIENTDTTTFVVN